MVETVKASNLAPLMRRSGRNPWPWTIVAPVARTTCASRLLPLVIAWIRPKGTRIRSIFFASNSPAQLSVPSGERVAITGRNSCRSKWSTMPLRTATGPVRARLDTTNNIVRATLCSPRLLVISRPLRILTSLSEPQLNLNLGCQGNSGYPLVLLLILTLQ